MHIYRSQIKKVYRRRYYGATRKEAYVRYSSAFSFFAICHPNGDSFKLMLYIRTRLSSTCKSTFSATFFHPCDSIKNDEKVKKKKKKQRCECKTHSQMQKLSRVLRQILMYLNHLWVCLVFYKVLAIFNISYIFFVPHIPIVPAIPFIDNQSILIDYSLSRKIVYQ